MSKTNLGLNDKALAAMTADELATWVKLGSEALRRKLAEANKPALLARRRAYERSRREKTVGVSFRLADKPSADAVRRVVKALAAAYKSSGMARAFWSEAEGLEIARAVESRPAGRLLSNRL